MGGTWLLLLRTVPLQVLFSLSHLKSSGGSPGPVLQLGVIPQIGSVTIGGHDGAVRGTEQASPYLGFCVGLICGNPD